MITYNVVTWNTITNCKFDHDQKRDSKIKTHKKVLKIPFAVSYIFELSFRTKLDNRDFLGCRKKKLHSYFTSKTVKKIHYRKNMICSINSTNFEDECY